MSDPSISNDDQFRRPFWEPIGQFVMEFGRLESAVDGVLHKALLLHERQGHALTSQIRSLSTKLDLAQELLLIMVTNTAQPVPIKSLVKEIVSLNTFRNNLVHGAWGMYDLAGQFWEKTWVEGRAFKTKTFRVKRDEVIAAINRAREAREALTRLSNGVVREFLAEVKHVPWPDKLRRQARKRRKTADRTPT
jgi:hypothetical protein